MSVNPVLNRSDELTDLNATRLCAEAMNYIHGGMWERKTQPTAITVTMPEDPTIEARYDPLHDDAQCFALVKRFRLNIGQLNDSCKVFAAPQSLRGDFHDADDPDLNRAVVYCVAKMQAAKK